jgi:hypothetical protein
VWVRYRVRDEAFLRTLDRSGTGVSNAGLCHLTPWMNPLFDVHADIGLDYSEQKAVFKAQEAEAMLDCGGKDLAMTTYSIADAHAFATDLAACMDRCDNNEGTKCATLDDALSHYADMCGLFRDTVRQWGRAVFTGRADYDPAVDRALIGAGGQLYIRSLVMWNHGKESEESCYALEGKTRLQAALWDLHRMLNTWVAPKRAVGPSARRWSMPTSTATDEGRRIVESLPPLPVDWEPVDPAQRALYRRFKNS